MSIIQTFPFDNAINYTLSNTQISGTVAKLSVVPNPNQLFQQTFSSDAGFTYNSAKAEFTGGLVRQKSQEQAPTIVSNVGLTSVGDTLEKAAGISAWDAGAISSEQMSGDGYVTFKPSFADKSFGIGLSNDNTDAGYAGIDFLLVCGLDGNIYLYENNVLLGVYGTYNALDTFKIESNAGQILYKKNNVVLHTSLSTPTFPLFMDCSFYDVGAKAIDIKINTASIYNYVASTVELPDFSYTGIGTVQAVESSNMIETGSPRYIVGGKYWNGSAWVVSNGTYSQANTSATVIANLTSLVVTGATTFPVDVLFTDSNVQSSVDLLEVTVTGQKYSPLGYLEPALPLNVQALSAYTQTETVDGDTAVKIVLKVDGVLKWWNGSAWATSDGTAAQANTEAEIHANVGSYSFGHNSTVYIRWILTSAAVNKTPELDEAIITYDFGGIEVDPSVCLMWGYLKDLTGEPIVNAAVKFELVMKDKQYKEANGNVVASTVTTTTDVNGYFEQNLIKSSEYEGHVKYKMSVSKSSQAVNVAMLNQARSLEFDVPDADNKNIIDLLTAV